MWLFRLLLLFCTQKTLYHQKFSKNGKIASEAVFGPVFSEIRENESTENFEKKWKLISDAKTSGEIFTTIKSFQKLEKLRVKQFLAQFFNFFVKQVHRKL